MPRTRPASAAALRKAAKLLGVQTGATVDDVMQARRAQAKLWHPDINPRTGSVERMGAINTAADLLCDFIRRGGEVDGVPAPAPPVTRAPRKPRPQPARVFEVHFGEGVSDPVSAPDRIVRLEIGEDEAMQGTNRTVRFMRSEPRMCTYCAGLGADPAGPKRMCPDCDGKTWHCPICEGRGWLHLRPGTCRHCAGTGAALVERSVRLKLPPGIDGQRRTLVKGWGDLAEDGESGNLWVDVVPAPTTLHSGPWRYGYFGHDWPPPEGDVVDGVLVLDNTPLPDDEMREIGFWRDPRSSRWVRQVGPDGAPGVMSLIRQRQFFVPQATH
ncbi:MAG: hypothetical protein ABR598_03450 [Candidatus Dormibacteria bacterium]